MSSADHKTPSSIGLLFAVLIMILWGANLWFALHFEFQWNDPLSYLLIFIQTHLYTGLFITAHDSIHGTVSGNTKLNRIAGYISALLFAFNWYPRLRRKHFLHHSHVATGIDPDYSTGKFLRWYLTFIKNYITWYQLIFMAITYNVLKLFFTEINISLYWMIPAILSTLQLFYFGTYLPHKGEHAPGNLHKARSQSRNHLWAFVSCYFFGYHYEHHDKPYVPWWRLWREK